MYSTDEEMGGKGEQSNCTGREKAREKGADSIIMWEYVKIKGIGRQRRNATAPKRSEGGETKGS